MTDEHGIAGAGRGWTDLVITPERPLRAVNALITGLHEPHATHLSILGRAVDAAAGHRPDMPAASAAGYAASHLERAYREAREGGYLWHEFGDSHLIIGSRGVPMTAYSSRGS